MEQIVRLKKTHDSVEIEYSYGMVEGKKEFRVLFQSNNGSFSEALIPKEKMEHIHDLFGSVACEIYVTSSNYNRNPAKYHRLLRNHNKSFWGKYTNTWC